MHCKNCSQKNCNDIEGDFDCLGLPSKTTVKDIIARATELLCTDCVRPSIEIESHEDSTLVIDVKSKGSADKLTIEIYRNDTIYKTLRVTETGTTTIKIPFGEYRIRAFDTYNFECTTGYINYSHQETEQSCIAPIVTVTASQNPATIIVNLLSMGESSSVDIRLFRENKIVSTQTVTSTTTLRFPVITGVYKVSVVGKCTNGDTVEEFTLRIVENNCDITVGRFSYDCTTGKVSASVTGGSTIYEYSKDGIVWVTNLDTLIFAYGKSYGLYIRDQNNTSCFTYYEFNALCECQLTLTASEIQCNAIICTLTLTYSEAQCSNSLICSINGAIQILK